MNFQTYVDGSISHFQNQLRLFLKKHQRNHCDLFDAVNYSVLNGGKSIRPLLVYCCGASLGIEALKLDAIAISIELIHAYSLIHDDLPAMDNAKLRRGKPSNHIKFGEAQAILAGDALQMLAIEALSTAAFLSDRQKIKLIHLLALAAGDLGMVQGQWLDLEAEGKQLNIDQLKKIHQLKTGKLIAACIMMPVSLQTKLPSEQLQEFANLLGIAYQIQDDLLDVEASTEILGKEKGIDEKLSKNTYPKVLGLSASKDYLATVEYQIEAILEKNNLLASPLNELVSFIFKRKY